MKKRRFAAADWLDLGLAALSQNGPDAIKLEAICKAAGLTRGSFYYHFEDHGTYLTKLAEHWFDRQTTQIAETVDQTAPPEDQTATLTDAALSIDYRLELGMRELARRVPAVHAIVRRADRVRLDVIAGLYTSRFDLDEDEAAQMAFIEYAAYSGMILLDPDMAADRQRDMAERFDRMAQVYLKTRPK